MLEFKPITLEDKQWIAPLLAQSDFNGCDYSFNGNFLWRKIHRIQVARFEDFYIVRTGEKPYRFVFPAGSGNLKAVMDELSAYCRSQGQELALWCVNAQSRALLEKELPGRFVFTEDRDVFDYVYHTEDLASLKGKKYHSKRNFVNRFLEQNAGRWTYEPMTPENLDDCRRMSLAWCQQNNCLQDDSKQKENCALNAAFDYFTDLGLQGGLLRIDGEVVAFTIGEPLNTNTYHVMFEKAFADVPGAYPMINQQFVQHACTGYAYVNREDDAGAEGLRTAKLSYKPAFLVEKYIAKEQL
ncbi:MAG TPA: DUF2156 domain-containing protein [Firmicutes bacterium]|nr:DUF2156 domain-containing protein [Bacillota bacterium]